MHWERETRYSRGREDHDGIKSGYISSRPSSASKLSAVVHVLLQIALVFYSLVAGGGG